MYHPAALMVYCKQRFNAYFNFNFKYGCTSSLYLFLITSGQSNAKIEELLQEDQNAKRRREKYQKQSSLLSKLTHQLSIHDNRAAASSYSNDSPEAGKLSFAF
jgi:hypothetical protein